MANALPARAHPGGRQRGDVEASFLLGSALANGLAVTEDDAGAVRSFRKAAEQSWQPQPYGLVAAVKGGEAT